MTDLRKITYADIIRMERTEPKKKLDVRDVQASHMDVQPALDVPKDVQDVQAVPKNKKLDVQDVQLPKSRSGRALLTSRQPVQRLEQFDFWCHQHNLDKQTVIGALLDALMSGRVPLDVLDIQDVWMSKSPLLMIDDEIGNNIISHYEKWTSNKARQTDLEALQELRQIPLEAVKCGILLSVLRAKGRVNSLRYCVGAAKEVAGSGQNDLGAYRKYLESKARRAGK